MPKNKDSQNRSSSNRSPELSDQRVKLSDKSGSNVGVEKSKKKNRFWLFLGKNISRRTGFIIIGAAFLLALIIIAANLYFSVFGSQLNSYYAYPDYQGPVLDTPAPLTGVLTTKNKAEQKVVSTMIENHPSARPQSGLSEAGLVYEALVEGGITRFLAFFGETDSKQVGPVRSARSYYLPWAKEVDAFYAHVGGSPEALELIGQYDIKSLNQFYNSQYYWRDPGRYSPHNVYTKTKDLRKGGINKGWSDSNDFDSWSYYDEDEVSDQPISDITINFSGGQYQASYRYFKKQNNYRRTMAGVLHKDLDGAQIKPTNVVVQVANQGLSSDGIRLDVETIGSGEAYIFTGGNLIKGSWQKNSLESRTKFLMPNGSEVKFNRGSTWIHVVSSSNNLEYSK